VTSPARRPRQLPALAVLALVAGGLLLAVLSWRAGALVLALALLLAAGLRLGLPPRTAGWLVVRSRTLDATVLGVLGAALALLALTIPPA
jgi:hypothetical protein